MGSSAQQHRVATGLFACLLSRSRKTRKRKTNCCSVSNISANIYGSLLTFIMIIYMGLLCGNIMATSVTRSQAWESCDYHATSQTSLWSASSLNEGNINIYGISSLLLILANDVELNPGPDHVSAEHLMEGLAQLAVEALAGQVKHIILSWSPDKDVRSDIDKQYRVPELKQTLAWLSNTSVEDPCIRKAEVIDAILVAIERLLPDMCGMCNQEYTVGRLAKPALQCGGCQQGFHEECLEAAFGSPSLPDLPGKLYWLCSHCNPRFSLMTAVGADGKTEKPRSQTHYLTIQQYNLYLILQITLPKPSRMLASSRLSSKLSSRLPQQATQLQ